MPESIGESAEDTTAWDGLLEASSDLIGAVERAVGSTGVDFAYLFREARIALGDDYPFLDPTLGGFEYLGSGVKLKANPAARTYVAGVSRCLGLVVDQLGASNKGARFRERVAVELAMVVRTRPAVFAPFKPYLDRIAGTRVL